MKKISLLVLTFTLMLALAACGQKDSAKGANADAAGAAGGEELTIKHQLGETKVKKNPKKVIVFDFGTLDTLDKLGIDVLGLPQSNVPAYLSKYKDGKYKNVGSLTEPDFEKVNAAKPDLIIISGRQQDSYKEFERIAPTIYLGLDTSKYMQSFKENAKIIGKIFGKEAEVDQELAKIDTSIQQINDKVKASGKNALIILANEGKISAFGAGSRFGLIHDVLGFVPADSKIEATTHGQSVSFEYVAEKNPDYLFVVDRSAVVTTGAAAAPAKQVVENDLVKTTKAFKTGHIHYLDPSYWYLSGGGLLSVNEMIGEVAKAVQ
ncbi:putative ABC transporter solute-binding protein YclQ [Paenibacillus sp. J31TS4]|uniref:siderophore ABC transporter substrate-binding protein n=1 Tax=Paenibacillus sp. J31TS4 TaxID=2807195 RepID=UPI001B2804B9|nr:siderophore ABC transporter substrate-binding protein [Paenibacillus sp. J31TS4]GIP40420.1 putative ABC transporter solute-binding protein YclQ [Paenibacillus sp. J31TS4]